jgi:hypothetical protein
MKTGILLQHNVDRARSLDRIVGELEPVAEAEGERAATLHRLEQVAQEFEVIAPSFFDLARDVERGYDWEISRAVSSGEDPSFLPRVREDLEAIFRLVDRSLDAMLRILSDYEGATGRSLPHGAAIAKTREAFRKLEKRLAEECPVSTEEEASEQHPMPPLPYDKLRQLADRHPAPPEWYAEEDNLF